MCPWVTPEAAPGANICIRVYCPSGVEYEAALRGAIFSLTEEWNWEKVEGQDVSVVAEAFFDANQLTLHWGRCVPIGTVLSYAGTAVPDGCLLCDGASYLVADYQELFDVIGYVFGGSGLNFNVPTLVAKFPLLTTSPGWVGYASGAMTHTLTVDEIPSHRHTVDNTQIYLDEPTPGIIPDVVSDPIGSDYTGYRGGGSAHNNMPPYVTFFGVITYR